MAELEQIIEGIVRRVLAEERANAAEFVSPAAFAAAHAISVKTVRRMIRDGRLPAQKIGHVVRIPADATIGVPVKASAKVTDRDFALRVLGGRR